jgi:hypothetical protein
MRAVLLLRRAPPPVAEKALIAEAREFARGLPESTRLQVCAGLDGTLAHIYAWIAPEALGVLDGAARPERLAPMAEWKGISAGSPAPYHYVVETDVEPDWEAEFNRWYHVEHMPGLAAVPGNVHCARMRSVDAPPRYRACYELESPQVLERNEWLAIRHTPWADRVRPHFHNTRRTMFRTLLDER